MEVDLILALAAAGTMLGVVEGLKPGPLMTMVVRETLSGGLKAGIWTAAAPIAPSRAARPTPWQAHSRLSRRLQPSDSRRADPRARRTHASTR